MQRWSTWVQVRQPCLFCTATPPQIMSPRLAQAASQCHAVPVCVSPQDSLLKHFHLSPQVRDRMTGKKRVDGRRVKATMARIQPAEQGIIGGFGIVGATGVEQLRKNAGLTRLALSVSALPDGEERPSLVPEDCHRGDMQ